MNEKPSLLIVSSSNTKPKSLIKLLTKSSNVQDDPGDSNKISHPWTIDTKYYTAEIDVIGTNEHYVRTPDFNDKVEALIIHMDPNKTTGLEDLTKWANIEEDCEPEVKLLLANYCTHATKITKYQATEWCLKHGFELVELYPSVDTSENKDKDVIEEKLGVERVIEALQAHMWSNLVMKEKATGVQVEANQSSLTDLCEEFLTNDGVDDFTDLFSQLSMMKNSIQSLPMGQRKQCAEQVVTAFWKAIGGDEEEIGDI